MSSQSHEAAPFFSIVIPTFNRARVIRQAISSCLSQGFAGFEIVVVDDGSGDNTEAVVKGIDDPRIIYHRQKNAGASVARNAGAALSTGRFIAFLDSDDEFLPGKLDAFREAIADAGPGADRTVWYSQLWFQRGESNRIFRPRRGIGPAERVGDYLFADEGLMQTSTLVVPRPLLLETGFDTGLRCLEDLDLCLRLEAAGAGFAMLDAPLVVWHDETADNRLSYSTQPGELQAWVAAARPLLSERAYRGFLARYMVPVTARAAPARAVRDLALALRHGAIPARRAVSLLLRGLMPGLYGRIRDAVVTQRGD